MDIYSSVPEEVLEDKSPDPGREAIYEFLCNSQGPKIYREIANDL